MRQRIGLVIQAVILTTVGITPGCAAALLAFVAITGVPNALWARAKKEASGQQIANAKELIRIAATSTPIRRRIADIGTSDLPKLEESVYNHGLAEQNPLKQDKECITTYPGAVIEKVYFMPSRNGRVIRRHDDANGMTRANLSMTVAGRVNGKYITVRADRDEDYVKYAEGFRAMAAAGSTPITDQNLVQAFNALFATGVAACKNQNQNMKHDTGDIDDAAQETHQPDR